MLRVWRIPARWPLVVLASIVAFGLVIGRVPVAPPSDFITSPNTKAELGASRVIPVEPIPAVFRDTTLEAGINFVHEQGDERLGGLDDSLGPGACAFDYDNNGWTDLFLVNGSGLTRFHGKPHWWQRSQGSVLLRNLGGGRFEDVTASAGLSVQLWGMGCLTGDFDNDGDIDLLVTGKGRNLLLANDGQGQFEDVTETSGIQSGWWSTSAATADYNGDGLLDLIVGNYIDFSKGQKTYEADSQFSPERSPAFDASLYAPQPNQLYLNLGGLKFREVAAEAGVANAEGRTLDVAWTDLNDDGRPDLVLSNDRGTGSNLGYINRDGRHFDPAPPGLRLNSALGTRGIAIDDITGDGEPDLVIASPAGENTLALVRSPRSGSGQFVPYNDLARETGIGASEFLGLSGWTPGLHDFNNDGLVDIFLAAGILDPDPDSPRIPQGQPKQVLLNRGNGWFVDTTAAAGMALSDRQSARGAVFADFDNDGRQDVYVAHNNDLGQLLMNRTPTVGHWLGLRLIGKNSNRDAIGARVRVTTAAGTQWGLVSSGEGFLSDGDKRLHFGLGQTATIDSVWIQWPDGRTQELNSLPIDRYLEIEEGDPRVHALPVANVDMPVSLNLPLLPEVAGPGLRARYITLLARFGDASILSRALTAASQDPDPGVRGAVIEAVKARKPPEGLGLLVVALEDADTGNVVSAITGLRQYEEETSVRWLLRSFSHSDPVVRVALAECFAYFFAEEEAVIHRKYLAIPYLILALDDPDPRVRRAAARALGDGERYRGLHSLLTRLGDPDVAARAEVVRALGLIRQGYALPALRRLLHDAGQPAEVLANALVALRRLNAPQLLDELADLVAGRGRYSAHPVTTRLDVLRRLMGPDEGATAFGRGDLQRIADLAFASIHPDQSMGSEQVPLVLGWISVKAVLSDPASLDWIEGLTGDPDPAIRAAAFVALLGNVKVAQAALVQRAWLDPDALIRRLAAKAMLANRKPLPSDILRTLLSDADMRAMALDYWNSFGVPAQMEPWGALLSANGQGGGGIWPNPRPGQRCREA